MLISLSLDFSVIKPDVGLLLWTTVFFLLFWIVIGKFAFKPISSALAKRQSDIQEALDAAGKAKAEMEALQAENDKLLVEAREERNRIIKEAKDTQNEMINSAKDKAKIEANKLITNATEEIQSQKNKALLEVKNEVGQMALDIAEKVLRKELNSNDEHKSYVNRLVGEIKLN